MGLNKSFRIIWSYCQSAWVVVGECTAGKGKSKGKSLRCQILLAAPAYLLMHETSLAQVQGLLEPTVRAGQAYVSQTSPNRLVIEQQSQRAVIDWKNFSIAQGQSLQFIQPSARSIALNRVTGQQASIIEGQLSANGQVWVLNPQGVIIGKQGRVDTQGFLATTLGLSNEDFLQGSYRFSMAHHSQGSATATGVIQNNGTINTPGAYAVLASDEVINNGLIQARLGTIALASGEAMTLDFAGDQLLRIDITEPIRRARAGGFAIENLGMLSAQGGQVLLTARGTKDVLNQAINTQGLIEATSAKLINGSIVLDGGASGLVQVDGSLNVSGMQAGERGGSVRVIGAGITLSDKAMLDARGDLGGGIIHLGGGWQGALAEGHSPAIRNYVAAGATLDASAVNEGNGGEIVVWSDVKNSNAHTWALGTFAATGGLLGGHGGRIETSGYGLSVNGIRVNAAATSGKAGEWLLDPVDITISDQPTNISSGVFGGTGTESFLQVSGLFGGTSDNSGLYPGTSGLIGSTDFFSQNSTTTVISPSTITSGLASSNVTIRTANGSTTESGNIYINSNINFPDVSNRTLYLLADGVITSNSSSITINGPASTTNKGTVVFAQGGNSSFQGRLTRNLDFVKSGVGELTLTQTQWGTSDGQAAFIEQGSLITNANNNQRGTLGYASDIVIGPGAEVRVSGQQENSYVGTDAYPRTTIEAGGKLRDASNDSGQSRANHLGEMVLAGGSIESTNSNTSWATWLFDKKVTAKANTLSSISGGNMSLNKSSEIAVEGNAELYISSNINSYHETNSGNSLIKSEAGRLILSGANTYTGTTTINAGTLQFGAGGTSGSLTSSSIVNNAGLNFNRSNNLTYAGTISGSGTVTKLGGGTLTLSGNNTYAGDTNVLHGNLVLQGYHAQLSSGPNYNIYSNSTLTFDRSDVFGNHRADIKTVLNIYDGGIVTNSGSSFNRLGALNFLGNGILTSTGSASGMAWALAGGVTVAAGKTASITGTGAVQLGSDTVTGTTLTTDNGSSLAVSANLTDGSTTVWPTPQNSSFLTKLGNGTLTLSGNNTFSGTTTVNGGTLSIASDANLGTTPGTSTTSHLVLNGGTLAYTGSGALNANRGISLGINGGTINVTSALSYGGIFANASGATGSLNKSGTGILTLSGANTYSGRTDVYQGTLVIKNQNYSSSYDIKSGATLEINVEYGTLDMQTSTAFSGGGILRKTGVGSLKWGTSAATFALNSGSFIEVSGGTFIGGSSANEIWTNNKSNLIVSAGASFSGVEANVRVNALYGAGEIKSGNSGAGYANFTFGVDGGSGNFQGSLKDDYAPANFIKVGSGTQTLSGNNTYNGTTTVNGGTLSIASDANLGTAPSASTPSHLVLNGGTLAYTGSGTLNANRGISLGSNGGTINVTNGLSYSGVIANASGAIGSLTKSGTGTLTLSGNNTYSGGTTINGGSLSISTDSNLGTAPNSTSASHLVLNGGSLIFTGSGNTESLNANRGISLGSNGGTINVKNGLSYGGVIANASGAIGPLSKLGNGSLTLSGNNTYSGGTTISGGILNVGTQSVGSLGAITSSAIGTGSITIQNGTALNLLGHSIYNPVVMAGDGVVTYGGIATGALFNSSNSPSAAHGPITLTGNASIRSYNGTLLTLGSISGNSYSLSLQNSQSLNTSGVIGSDTSITASGLFSTDSTLINSTPQEVVINGQVNLNTLSSPWKLTINGDLVLTSLNLGGSLTLNSNGASQINGVIANASGAIGSLTKTGSGTLTLSGNNTYSGGTALEQGLIRLGSSTQVTNRLITAGPIGTGALDVKSGATLDLNGNTLANALALSGQGQSNQGALINTSTSAATVLGDITLTADTTMATRGDLVFSSIDGTTGLGNSASLGIKTQPLSQWTSLTISSDSSDPYRLTLKTSPSLGLGPGDVVRFSKLVGGKLSEGFGVVTSVNDAAASELSIRTDFKIAGSSEFSIDKVDTTAPKLSLKSLESNASSRITIDRALALGGLTVDSQVALKVTGQQIATIGSQSFSGPVVIDNASIGGPCASTWLLECYFNEQIFSNPTVFSSLKGSIDFQSTLNSYTASPSNRSVLITHGNVAGVSTENPALRFSDSVGVQGEFGAFIAKAPSIAIGPTNSSLKAKAIELKVAPASGITAIPSVILNGQVTLEPTVSRLTITSEGGSLVTSGGFLSKAIDQELSISLASTTSGVNTAGTLWADKSWASPQLPFGQVTVTASKFSSYGSEFCSVLDPLNCSAKSQTVSVYTNKLHAKLESPTSVLRDEFLINKAAAEEAAAKAAAEAAAKKAAEEAAAKAAAEAAAKKAAEEAAAKAAAEAAAKKAAEEAAAKAAAEAAAKKAAEEAAAKAAAEAAAKKAAEEVTARAAVEASRVVQAATQAATSSVAAANNAVSAAARVPAVTPTPTPSTAVAATPTASTSASQSSTASALQDSSSSQGATPSSGSPQSSTNDASSTQGSTSPPSSSPSGSSTAGSGVQSPTPASPSTSAAASRTASSGQTSTPTAASASTLPAVPPSPPSPVPTSKPPTPKDNADASDRTLASVKSPQAPKPASQAQRVTTKLVAVSGMVVTQVSSPPALPPGSTLDQNVPALPNPGKW